MRSARHEYSGPTLGPSTWAFNRGNQRKELNSFRLSLSSAASRWSSGSSERSAKSCAQEAAKYRQKARYFLTEA